VGRNDRRWEAIEEFVPDVQGRRVLDVGSNAGYDAFMFHLRGAAEVVACEPYEFIEQARFLESVYRTGIRFEQIGWQRLDPELHGTFDLVHCNGVLYHEPNPIGMLQQLRKMVSDGGQLLLGCMMLDDAERSEHARFVRSTYAEDPTWWWVPGRLALRWMMDACGFDAELLPVRFNGPRGEFAVINGYLRGRLADPDPQLAPADSTSYAAAVNRFPLGHYYSPMYDTRELEVRHAQLWPAKPRDTVGIDWREDAQLELCRTVFADQQELQFVDQPSDDPSEYYALNDQYPPDDAWVLAGVLEHFRPARMIEVGCGFSTLISARVNREKLGMGMRLECIEPYPRQFLLDGVPGVSDLRIEKIQDTPLELFEELSAGDVLFVDTAHTVKTGGDVVWIFNEIIPRLGPGVLVHVHDVFLPGEYPQKWVFEGWGWNESYLVRAFLAFNQAFEVVWGQQFMLQRHLEEVFRAFPDLHRYGPSGAALWIRRL
jgi:SAM-dependent methyltransferase